MPWRNSGRSRARDAPFSPVRGPMDWRGGSGRSGTVPGGSRGVGTRTWRAVDGFQAPPWRKRERIVSTVEGLRSNPLAGSVLSGEWKGFWRLRVGSSRVICGLDGEHILVTVLRVAHHRSVYQR